MPSALHQPAGAIPAVWWADAPLAPPPMQASLFMLWATSYCMPGLVVPLWTYELVALRPFHILLPAFL